ncbi:unnamed protein product [Paramecium pentaurelia]|uniref:Uncharacterized protein n=1 Tax=Paramecium pentaurelia TaxID=43138 RepID=A0A8S1UC12_9CILI|nr:unnamed protein product [Paramecium pentaurelia]
MDILYKVWIEIFPTHLEIDKMIVQLPGNLQLLEFYIFIIQNCENKIQNKNWQQWKAKSDKGIFPYSEEMQISQMFGDVLIGNLKIYTNPIEAHESSIFDIQSTQSKDTNYNRNNFQLNANPQEIKPLNIYFNIIDPKSSLKYSCLTNTNFTEVKNALYCYLTLNQGVAEFDFFLDGNILKFTETQTFGQLDIVTDTVIDVKIRWSGGFFNNHMLLLQQGS